MDIRVVEEAIALVDKANTGLQAEPPSGVEARALLRRYLELRSKVDFGVAVIAAPIDDSGGFARLAGTSVSTAKTTVATGKVLAGSKALSEALRHGEISSDQAAEIATAEASSPGCAQTLVAAAKEHSFAVLRERARKVKLEAERHRGLSARQHRARSARTYTDDIGMVNIHLSFEPHVGTPIVARAEAQAQRLARAVRRDEREPFERYLADAYAQMLSGSSVKGRARRPELVMLVSYEVAERGWTEVRDGEVCKIPGVGPITPETAKAIARDAFVNAVVCDGKDLRQFKRFTPHIPIEVQIALELGDPPEFDGVQCVDCGNRFRTQFDHVEPRAASGPTSQPNLKPRCWECHQAKTTRDLLAGKLAPQSAH